MLRHVAESYNSQLYDVEQLNRDMKELLLGRNRNKELLGKTRKA